MKKNDLKTLIVTCLLVGSLLTLGISGCTKTQPSSGDGATTAATTTATSAATTAASAATETKTEEAGVKKIAMLLPGSISDQSWNAGAHSGLMQLKDEGFETAFTENVQVANIEATFRNYASQGFEFMIGHGFQFGDAAMKVGAEFPEKWFFVFGSKPSGIEAPANVGFVDQKEFEAAYICGVIAGMTTKTGKIGFLGGIEGPSQLANANAYKAGAESVKQDIQVITIMSGTFGDPAKGKEAGLAQIEQGADILMHTCDLTGLGMIEAAKEKGVMIIGYGGDQRELAPELVLTSLMAAIPEVITNQVARIQSGTFSGVWNPGIKENVIDIGPFGSTLPEETKAKALAVKQEIIDGKLTIEPNYNK